MTDLIGKEFKAEGSKWVVVEEKSNNMGIFYVCRKVGTKDVLKWFLPSDIT